MVWLQTGELRYVGALAILFLILTFALGANTDVISMPHDESPDPIRYMEGAERLGSYDSNIHPPIYSVAIALFMLTGLDPFSSAKLVSAVAGAVMILLIYGLAVRCFNSRRTGVVAATLATMTPLLINAGYAPGSDMLATTFFLASVYAMARYRGDWRWLVAAGVAGGLAFHTRYAMIGFVPAALLYLGSVLKGTARQRIVRTAICLGAFAAVTAPWVVAYLLKHGEYPLYDHKYLMMAALDTRRSWLSHLDMPQKGSVIDVFRAFPTEIARNWAKNAAYFPIKILAPYATIIGLVAVLGLPQLFRRMTAPRLFFLLQGAFLLGVTFFTLLKPRFFVPVLPMVLIVGAYILAERLPFRL